MSGWGLDTMDNWIIAEILTSLSPSPSPLSLPSLSPSLSSSPSPSPSGILLIGRISATLLL